MAISGQYKKRAPKKATRKYTRKPQISTAIKRYVKSTLHSNIENKKLVRYATNQSIFTTQSSPYGVNLLPVMSNGPGSAERLGQVIRVMKGVISGRINLLPYNSTTNPQPLPVLIKMWVVSKKASNSVDPAVLFGDNDFFDAGPVNIGFQGNLLDLDLPINKSQWVVHNTKTVKVGASNSTTAGPTSTGSYLDNSPMSVPYSFNWGRHVKKLMYKDAATNNSERNLFLIFQPLAADGSSSAGYGLAETHYVNLTEYEDA